ncbi:PAS domain-containing protein [bacterium]|nr:MAG: PAS domain-containing protein [bacterium]
MTGKKGKSNEASVPESSHCRSGDDSLPCCAILESMTDGVFTVDLDRRINTFFNRAVEEITGFTLKDPERLS